MLEKVSKEGLSGEVISKLILEESEEESHTYLTKTI